MQKKSLIIIASFLIVVVAAGAFLLTQPKEETASTNESSFTNNSSMPLEISNNDTTDPAQPSASGNATPGVYADYSDEALANATGTTILFFHADWCSQCRSIEKGISPETLPENVTFLKVDYDSRQDLRQKYDVTLQTTFIVLDSSGNVVKKHVAYEEPTFEAVKQAIL